MTQFLVSISPSERAPSQCSSSPSSRAKEWSKLPNYPWLSTKLKSMTLGSSLDRASERSNLSTGELSDSLTKIATSNHTRAVTHCSFVTWESSVNRQASRESTMTCWDSLEMLEVYWTHSLWYAPLPFISCASIRSTLRFSKLSNFCLKKTYKAKSKKQAKSSWVTSMSKWKICSNKNLRAPGKISSFS